MLCGGAIFRFCSSLNLQTHRPRCGPNNEDENDATQVLAVGLFVAGLLLREAALVRSVAVAAADEAKSAAKKEPWKPEDFIYAEDRRQYRISPDSKWLVWVKSTGDKDKDARVSNLFLSSLTEDARNPAHPRHRHDTRSRAGRPTASGSRS